MGINQPINICLHQTVPSKQHGVEKVTIGRSLPGMMSQRQNLISSKNACLSSLYFDSKKCIFNAKLLVKNDDK